MRNKSLHEVCEETGATRRAVQGYEKAGLVAASGKNKYGHLLYDEPGVERIRTIRFFQEIGLSLREIQEIIDAPADGQRAALQLQIRKLQTRSQEISQLITQIEQYILQL